MADYEDYTPDEYDEDYERESPEVYRRRRIITAIIALLVLVLVIWGVVFAFKKISATAGSSESAASPSVNNNFASFSARPSSSQEGQEDEADGSASPTSTESAAPAEETPQSTESQSVEPTESAAEPTATASEENQAPQACGSTLQVSVSVDQQSYAAGQNPQITAHVGSTSQSPCTVNLGTSNVNYVITSGPAQVFDSRTCQGPGTAQETVIKPGETVTTAMTWDRQMTVYGCGEASLPAQTGYYWVTATVNGVSSEPQLIIIQ